MSAEIVVDTMIASAWLGVRSTARRTRWEPLLVKSIWVLPSTVVAEMRFGLTCVRSCLWAAFAAPVVLLAMQEVFPFALELEQSAVSLGLMTVVFAVSAWLSIALERAPLIGQMFTKDPHNVSLMDVMRIMGTKLLLLLLMLAATLTPNLGEWLQNLVGMLRI